MRPVGGTVRGRLLPRGATARRRGVGAILRAAAQRPGGFASPRSSGRRMPRSARTRAVARAGARGGRAGPFGHHTHWTAPDHARPTSDGTGARVLAEGALEGGGRARADALLRRRLVHGRGGRGRVRGARLRRLHAARVASAVSRRGRALGIARGAGARSHCRRGERCAPMPTTHSLGDLARASPRRELPATRARLLPRHRSPEPPAPALLAARCSRFSRDAPRATDLDRLAARRCGDAPASRLGRRELGSKLSPCRARPLRRRSRRRSCDRRQPTRSAERDVRASRLYILSRGPILSLVRRAISIAALVVAGRRRARARDLHRARPAPARPRRRRHPLEPALARGAGRVAQVRRADHRARLRPGRPLPRSASGGPGPGGSSRPSSSSRSSCSPSASGRTTTSRLPA